MSEQEARAARAERRCSVCGKVPDGRPCEPASELDEDVARVREDVEALRDVLHAKREHPGDNVVVYEDELDALARVLGRLQAYERQQAVLDAAEAEKDEWQAMAENAG